MKNRIRTIFFLMGACILGINLFQGYWLYSSYQFNLREFRKNVTEALFEATRQLEISEAGRTIGQVFERQPSGNRIHIRMGETSRKKIMVRDLRDSLFVFESGANPSVIQIETTSDSLRTFRARVAADTLARQISSMLVMKKFYDRKFELARLDSMYRAALAEKGIDAAFRLDTLRPEPVVQNGAVFIDLDKVGENGPVTTTLAPVNMLSNLFVRASFPNTQPVILRRMAGLLVGSLLLFLLTTGCLIYMLRTILAQKRLSEIKSDFINNMTHELKTPIATVSAAVEALQHFNALDDEAKVRDYLQISRHELGRLSDLVEKVLNIAVEERRELEMHAEPVDVVSLIEKLVAHHRVRAGRPVLLRFEHSLSDPVVRVDPTHFTNAINNLIDNAIKYSPEEVDVLVRCMREDGWLRVSVRDNGIGIPRDYQQSIFEQFFRVPRGDLHEVKGFGLGLSYVKRIIEKHGGRITVSSELSRGSEFVISIPA